MLIDNQRQTFDEKCVLTLNGILRKKRKILRKVNIPHWISCFRDLRRKDGIEKSRIRKVLKWYSKHILDQYTPKAYSAKTFREKFFRIEDAMNRDQKVNVSIIISKEAKQIYNRLSLIWPHGIEKDDVLTVIQISLDNYREFRKSHNKIAAKVAAKMAEEEKKKYSKSPSTLDLFIQNMTYNLTNAESFVYGWMEDIHHKLIHWPDWNGKLVSWVFKPESDKFQRMGRQWANEYSDADLWDKYFQKI